MISICLPIYRPNLLYISELANSIRSQTLKSYEVVISDNGDSEQMIRSVFEGINFKYYKYLGPKQIFSNLNNAIKKSTGNYIQFLCQDDVMKPHMLERQLESLLKYPNCKFIYTQISNIDEMSNVLRKSGVIGDGMIAKDDLSNYLLVFGCLPGNLSPVMIKRDILFEIGLFNTGLNYASDFHLWIRLSMHSGMAINYEELLSLRSHAEQASTNLPAKYYLKDMNINLRLLFDQSNFKFIKKYFYINSFYGKTILLKCINEFRRRRNLSSLLALFTFRFPLSIIIIIPYVLLFYLGVKFKFNFGKYNSFPKPISNLDAKY